MRSVLPVPGAIPSRRTQGYGGFGFKARGLTCPFGRSVLASCGYFVYCLTMASSAENPQGIGRIFNSPIIGFVPFIIMSLFSSPDAFFYAVGLAVFSAILIVVVNWYLNHIPAGQIDWAALILFGVMLIVGLAVDSDHTWLMKNANLISDITVIVVALAGMAIGRPFALMYARLSPKFEVAWQKDIKGFRNWGLRACQIISLFWFAAFVVQLVCQLLTQFGPASYDTAVWNWVIPVVALLLAMRQTRRYSVKLRTEAASFEQPNTAP